MLRQGRLFVQLVVIITIFYAVVTFLTVFFLKQYWLQYTTGTLESLANRITNELQYTNGTWNTTFYNADPHTPHPHGSSGFSDPLYIVTTDGAILERNQPINGLLDSSDFKHLITFQEPQTIKIVTNEQWRVLSRPVVDAKGNIVAVVMAAHYNPIITPSEANDMVLKKNIQGIVNSIRVSSSGIDVGNVDIRKIDFDISFEIVDRSNHVLLNNGRMPTFIDTSYVAYALHKYPRIQTIHSETNNEAFLVITQPIIKASSEVGIIVLGRSQAFLEGLLRSYVKIIILWGVIFIPLASSVILSLFNKIRARQTEAQLTQLPSTLHFDAKESAITHDGKKIIVPYATNQYNLVKALFTHPRKRWEFDELLKEFGEENEKNNWRKVYDAALSLNKKVGYKLVEYKDKTYRMNPQLAPRIH